ncbi:bromodomain adjacent to zinc finger domain protein 1A-like isoform X2 [Leptotrombidium deliense]|uniref:Bromodomain adjacent to zinc finger domain protein 1A-like isoform X2 n=1 Tax=Leptotrombidium deliense TaxID=299467 RepID=A0A443SRF9_9ACAR|nr:bromodomain adjacent to zinc finger domain protein 1A-like isoform X2 [Leptotrombidium deliense]
MPLLNKEPFSRIPLPENIDSDDEVYYCSSTQEAFTDYEAFFERAILCSSMVWTCSVTGRNGLTFQEALESEETAKSMLNSFPESLQMPVLFLVSCMNEHKFNHIVHMVSTFISNRYFVGEEVYVIVNDKKIKGRIERVIPPTEAQLIDSYKKNNEMTIAYGCDPSLFKYDIEHVLNKDLKVVVGADCVARAKGTISKDKVKLFLKQHITAEKRFQKMKIKDASLIQFGLENICWDDLFAGPFPNFTSETQIIRKDKTKTNSDDNVNTSSENKKKYKKVCQEMEGVKEAFKQLDKELLKKQKLEQKLLERERIKEEKRQRELILQEWNKKREDLQCDDLQPLPESTPVDCLIPNELFGDSIMIMEFFYNFRELFGIKVVFPNGITFEILQEMLTSHNIYGPFGDLMELLLRTIFALQEEENRLPILPEELKSSDDDSDNESAGIDCELISALKAAKSTSTLLLQCHSVSLNDLPISPFDITEMVRLHILTSGAGERINRNHRGWFSGREDSCLSFKREHPNIIEFLANHTIFELGIADRLKLLHALINQIVTFSRFRDYIEETAEKVSELKRDLRELEKSLKPENKGDKNNNKQKKEAAEAPANEVNEPNIETRLRTNKECKKIEELKHQIRELQSVCRLKPVGVDRLCRKYWWFNSLNGLFVERDDVSWSTCSSRCSTLQDLALKSKCSVTLEDIKHSTAKCNNSYSHLSNEDRSTASDKENDCVTPPKSIAKLEKYPRKEFPRTTLVHLVKDGKNYCFPGNPEVTRDCKWSFYFKNEDIEALISSLNNRGFRESELKKVLKRDEKFLIQALQLCPVILLNPNISNSESFDRMPRRFASRTQTCRLNYGKQKLIKFADLSSEKAMEAVFRFNCLKLEEKLFDGGLCVDDDRNQWRAALQDESKIMTLEECIQYFLNLVLSIQVQFLKDSFKKEDGSFTKWKDSLLNCKSFSQLFFHKITLEKNITWSKIASNAACIVCSTKKHPGKMLLCDECNSGFHTYCINPPLEEIPVGEWFCFSCAELRKPLSPRKVRQNKIHYTEKSSTESSSSSSESPHESDSDSTDDRENRGNNKIKCVVCKKNNVDVNCLNCGRNFHNKCHSPPITRPLRKNWACCKCHSTDNISREEFHEPQQKRMKTRYNQDYDYQSQNPIENQEKIHEKKRQTRSVTQTDTNMKKCIEILTRLKNHQDAVHFIKCPTSKEAPKYNNIIKRHVDFNLVTSKLNSTEYKSDDEFILDIYLIMQNCWLYWGKFTEPYRAAKRLFIFLKQLLSEYGFERIKGSLN